mmetsp:Transcript_11716/g.13470  ORF Transcript_11716/g.13470 Transcript_11716/m.13470 type:complete len:338 (+) Transcript_11716:174-1187(+)|eukprot:CAMPEP_0184014178 /NCGR_PEP_ID=MMETSP0954-20121128/5482_1 /TAXON_ID=627963 /ORGANISM="Aplanochytrium sp, Strain PBS07" /LENGTH=337 /DNA_ID=CAMNT_0026294565 /DNA_START=322 /DNA_END=1335 /DNA_ORIENTATION=+
MATTVEAYAINEAGLDFKKISYELGELEFDDVDIEIKHCGICHSDLSMAKNEWGMTQFPYVPGHEAVGIVKAVGSGVSHLKVGDKAGVGWHAGYCNTCSQCTGGDHNLCTSAQGTMLGGKHGAFGTMLRAKGVSAIKIPDAMELADIGPLFCGGITVFNPLVQYAVSPLAKVGVIGIGGLGHIAVQFLNAWGCHVTAFTGKTEDIESLKALGVHEVVNSRKPEELKAHVGEFDMIMSTVNVGLDWNSYISCLKPKGRLHVLGAVPTPLDVQVFPMLLGQKSVSSSPVGSPANIRKMLDFCLRHNIKPVTEHFPIENVREAMEHLEAGKAKFRIVLDF